MPPEMVAADVGVDVVAPYLLELTDNHLGAITRVEFDHAANGVARNKRTRRVAKCLPSAAAVAVDFISLLLPDLNRFSTGCIRSASIPS